MPVSGMLIFLILYLFTISPVNAEQSGVLRIDIRKDSTEKLLRSVLNDQTGDFISERLEGQTLGPISFGSDPGLCSLENLKAMEITKAWTDCPGLPEWMFPDAKPELLIKPRPTIIKIKRMEIVRFNSGIPQINCSADDRCLIKISINDLKLSFDLGLTTLLPEPRDGANKSFEFSISSLSDQSPASLTIPIDLRYTGPDHRWINSPGLDFKGKANWNISLNQTIISGSFSDKIFQDQLNLDYFDQLIPGLEHQKLPLLINAINSDLLGSDVIQSSLESLLEKQLNGSALDQLNALINTKVFNHPFTLPLKTLNVGNFVNAERHFLGNLSLKLMSENLLLFMEQVYSTSSLKKLSSDDEFSNYEMYFITFLQSLKASSNEKDLGYLNDLQSGLSKIYQKLLNLKSDAFAGSLSGTSKEVSYLSACIKRSQTLFVKLLDLQARVEAANKSQKIQYKSTLIPSGQSAWPYPLSFNFLSNWGDSDFLNQHSGSVISETEHDLAITISLDSLNQLLKDLHRRGVFNFSYYDQQNAALDSRPRSDIELTFAPTILWDNYKKKYLLNIPEIYAKTRLLGPVKTWDTLHFKMWFLPEIKDGKFYLNPEISGSPKIISLARPLIMLTNFLKTATIVHPVVAKILINTLIAGTGNELLAEGFEFHEIKIEEDFMINFEIKDISNRKKHISFYLSFP